MGEGQLSPLKCDSTANRMSNCVGVLPDHPQVQVFTRTPRTQCTVVLMAVTYYGKRAQA